MKKRRESRTSRAGLIKEGRELSPAKKFFCDVLLVCELMLFITVAVFQGGQRRTQSTPPVKDVRTAHCGAFSLISRSARAVPEPAVPLRSRKHGQSA